MRLTSQTDSWIADISFFFSSSMKVQGPHLKLVDVSLTVTFFPSHYSVTIPHQKLNFMKFRVLVSKFIISKWRIVVILLYLLMKRDSRMIQRPRNAFVFIREGGSYWDLNAGRRRAVLCRRGVGSYSRDCLLISVPDFPRALLLRYESPRKVSSAKSIQLYKFPGLHQ